MTLPLCLSNVSNLQEGEEANTTVDSEGKDEAGAEEEPKAPRELTAEELEAKVNYVATLLFCDIKGWKVLLTSYHVLNDHSLFLIETIFKKNVHFLLW